MKPVSLISIVAASLLALGGALVAACARNCRAAWIEAPATAADGRVSQATRAQPPGRSSRPNASTTRSSRLEIERALVARDPQQRETAFNFLLPELLQAEPQRVVDMVARQEPGEARDALRDEVARQWITRDRDAAIGG